jgi:hypothetical protein
MEPARFTGSDYWYVFIVLFVVLYIVHVVANNKCYKLPLLFSISNSTTSVSSSTWTIRHIAIALPNRPMDERVRLPPCSCKYKLDRMTEHKDSVATTFQIVSGRGRTRTRAFRQQFQHVLQGWIVRCVHGRALDTVDDAMWYVMNNLVRLVHTPSDEEVERQVEPEGHYAHGFGRTFQRGRRH